jgi:hypothetical protein
MVSVIVAVIMVVGRTIVVMVVVMVRVMMHHLVVLCGRGWRGRRRRLCHGSADQVG